MRIPKLQSGGLITNYFCTSKCKHCLYSSGPDREKHYMTPGTARINLDTITALGCTAIHVGGGEPMLRPDDLGRVLEVAKKMHVHVDYVETNSSWFHDVQTTVNILRALKPHGLHTLLVSISPFHNEFVPYKKVQGVLQAATRAGVAVFPWVQDFIPEITQFDIETTHSLSEYEEHFGKDYIPRIPERYWLHYGGRALDMFRPWFGRIELGELLLTAGDTCRPELKNTTHFHMDLYGNYIPGLCVGLNIKREHVAHELRAQEYPRITLLAEKGIRGLFAYAKTHGFIPSRTHYINKCDVCTEIRLYLNGNNRPLLE